jgi:hypothetical protein
MLVTILNNLLMVFIYKSKEYIRYQVLYEFSTQQKNVLNFTFYASSTHIDFVFASEKRQKRGKKSFCYSSFLSLQRDSGWNLLYQTYSTSSDIPFVFVQRHFRRGGAWATADWPIQ